MEDHENDHEDDFVPAYDQARELIAAIEICKKHDAPADDLKRKLEVLKPQNALDLCVGKAFQYHQIVRSQTPERLGAQINALLAGRGLKVVATADAAALSTESYFTVRKQAVDGADQLVANVLHPDEGVTEVLVTLKGDGRLEVSVNASRSNHVLIDAMGEEDAAIELKAGRR